MHFTVEVSSNNKKAVRARMNDYPSAFLDNELCEVRGDVANVITNLVDPNSGLERSHEGEHFGTLAIWAMKPIVLFF